MTGCQVNTLYAKGARQRTESVIQERARANATSSEVIQQCDEKRGVILNENDKLYASFEIEDWSERLKKSRPARLTQMSGPEVTVTIDSIDTGERRQFQDYTARPSKSVLDPSQASVLQRLRA